MQQRPDTTRTLPAFQSPSLSKAQLSIHALTTKSLILQNVGRRHLLLNGRQREGGEVVVGDVVEVGSQLTLLCAARPQWERPDTPLTRPHAFGAPDAYGFVGESPAAQRLRSEWSFAAPRAEHVLVLGESGTGKELVARALHAESRRPGALVARNATTLPDALIDAELFGNAKGYPNPGMAERKGLIGSADGGTLFLDEFADLPLAAQAHVLRVLDSGEYHRLGEDRARRSAFRLVAATNRPESALRADVLARFGFRIRVPPLAERLEDIPLIAHSLLQAMVRDDRDLRQRFFEEDGMPRLAEGFVRHLVCHRYAANVRDLRRLLWRALSSSPGRELVWPSESTSATPPSTETETETGALGREQLQSTLDANNGSIEKTWRALGLANRHVLNRLLRKYGIEVKKQLRA